jgi:L-serine dehydratase
MPTALSMPSIRYIFRSGRGPSSSHTIGPFNAAKRFLEKNYNAESYRVTLYGSLAATHEGHMTDKAIKDAFSPRTVEFKFKEGSFLAKHPNGMMFEALDPKGKTTSTWMAYSVGGGTIMDDNGIIGDEAKPVYPTASLSQIIEHCRKERISLWHYVEDREKLDLKKYLREVNQSMKDTIRAGVTTTGTLPGPLKHQRIAKSYYDKAMASNEQKRDSLYLFAFALACAEENAAGNFVVTAPTCGSSGVLPSVLNLMKHTRPEFADNDDEILRAIETAGLIGNLAKANASISGAEVGCQGEIGVASAMAAAAAAQLMGGNPYQIEYAAEIALEHRLGLTCDPVGGYVQVPCIERNATAAVTAYSDALYALVSDGNHLVSFDTVLRVMKKTGCDLQRKYKETAEGGLAAEIKF